MKPKEKLDEIHKSVTEVRTLQLFTAFTRVLLAVGFIPPSINKILYLPFTLLPATHPVGYYFDALYKTGFYYQFIGWGQIIAAVLLLIPRTSHLGALMFLPIIINITVLTNSVGFQGTWLITIFMSIASIYLVCWDYDRWKTILFFKRPKKSDFFKYELIWLPVLFAVGGVTLFLTASFMFGAISQINTTFLLVIAFGGTIFGLIIALHHKFMRVGNMKVNNLD